MKKVLLVLLVAVVLSLALGGNVWADITDPADLHVGPGAGTACATGCGGDPNTISSTNWDIYYNSHGTGQLPIGSPFYLIVAVAEIGGVAVGTPSVDSTATLYNPYPGGTTSSVSVAGGVDNGVMTSAQPNDIYSFLGLGSQVTNSFNFVNMVACDTGLATCPNSGLQGSGAPLAGDTISGFDIVTFSIGTTSFSPGQLLDFTGTLPIGSYVAAIGVNGTEAWAVPFTESGLVTHAPEPGSFVLLGAGLLALAVLSGRRLVTA